MLKMMRNDIKMVNIPDANLQLNYKELFLMFVKQRKIKLLRYLFNQKIEFEFNTSIFIMALEEDAYDVATLLHNEFRYLMRENSIEENRHISSLCVSSINKTNQGGGMIEQKCYLCREYID